MAARRASFTVGIIGTGVGIRTQAAGFGRLRGVKIVGIVGSSLERTRSILATAGLDPSLACSLDDLLRAEPRLLSLTTPPAQRAAYIPSLASCPSALLIEKPLAPDYSSARRIYDPLLRRPSGGFLNTQLRGLPAVRMMHQSIRDGAIGQVYSVSLRERSPALRQPQLPAWQLRVSSGGGQRLAIGPHLLDLALYLANKTYAEAIACKGNSSGGAVIPLRSLAGREGPPADAADEAFTGSVSVGGCLIQMHSTGIGDSPRLLEFDVEGTGGLLRFSFCEGRGRALIFASDSHRRLALDSDGNLRACDAAPAQLDPSLFRISFSHYARDIIAICQGASPNGTVASIADGLRNMEILDAMRQRHAHG